MIGRYALAVSGGMAILGGCELWVHTAGTAACVSGEAQASSSVSLAQLPLLLLAGVIVAAWGMRVLWLSILSTRALHRLPEQPRPCTLTRAVERTRVDRVLCVDSAVPSAFCGGMLRPHIVVTLELLRQLRPEELDAVLLHEEHHRRHRDPLRYLLRRAAADVLFLVPLLQWWSEYAGQSAELRADRVVLAQLGPKPLAGALWSVAAHSSSEVMPGFRGAAELRAAQLLGDRMPRRSPTACVLLRSVLGLTLALQLAWCLSAAPNVLHQAGI